MITARREPPSALISLEAAAASARSGFACMFSSSDEYERALIALRRAQGRYAPPGRNLLSIAFVGLALMVAIAAIAWG